MQINKFRLKNSYLFIEVAKAARNIIRPEKTAFWPNQDNLEWHRGKVYCMPIRLTQNGALGYDPAHVRLSPDTVRVSETLP